jgi:hypothetical protein
MEIKLCDRLSSKTKKATAFVDYDVDWKVSFNLAFLPKPELSSMLGKFNKQVLNKKTHQFEPEVDSERLSEEILRNYVLGWKGVTYEWLNTQVPINLEGIENIKEEIPFSYENLKILADNVYTFDGWILDSVKNGNNFNVAKKEEETKN